MLVGKDVIGFGIEQLTMFYPDFDRFIEKKGIETVVDAWYSMFKKIEYDYDLAEQDFKKSVFDLISNSKSTPTFSNILDGMRELNKQRELNELKFKQLKNR